MWYVFTLWWRLRRCEAVTDSRSVWKGWHSKEFYLAASVFLQSEPFRHCIFSNFLASFREAYWDRACQLSAPLPSAAIIPRYRPTFWPSSLWGVGRREGNRALPASDMHNTMKRAEGVCIYTYIFPSLHIDMHRLIWKACACVACESAHPMPAFLYVYIHGIYSICSSFLQHTYAAGNNYCEKNLHTHERQIIKQKQEYMQFSYYKFFSSAACLY